MTLLLASASPRRRELLASVGVPFTVAPADVDETQHLGEAPLAYVARVAAAKAAALVRSTDTWVLAADTIVELEGVVLGKAADAAEATEFLHRLSGRVHRVSTAFVVDGPRRHAQTVTTEVEFISLSPETIAAYVATHEWRGKAGAYAVQGIAGAFVRRIHGSISSVVGLPLAEVLAALAALGAPGPDFSAGRPA